MKFPNAKSRFTGYVTGVAYLLILLAGAVFGGRQALSNFYAQSALRSGSEAKADTAILLQAENPYAHEIRGVLLERRNDNTGAAECFRNALVHRPNDYLLWLHFGNAELKTGNIAGAGTAFETAIDQAPGYSVPHLSMGRMHLEIGNTVEAFRHLSAAARLEPALYPEILHLARVAFADDPVAIEDVVHAETTRGKLIIARYFIEQSWMTDRLRAFLTGDELSPQAKNYFIEDLKSKGNFIVACEVWLSRLGEDTGVPTSPLYDGGFEKITESDPSGLGWQIDQDLSGVAVARDRAEVHSGENALHVRFSGNVVLQQPIISQLAFVLPRRRYSVTFAARVNDIVSAGLPAVVVSDAATRSILATSKPLTDTASAWMRHEISFTAPDAPVVRISLQRPTCPASPCPIFGELSLDDMSIVEEP